MKKAIYPLCFSTISVSEEFFFYHFQARIHIEYSDFSRSSNNAAALHWEDKNKNVSSYRKYLSLYSL